MAEVKMVRRLVNPGKRRKLSPLQKLFFGSKRQRAAVAKRNAGKYSIRKHTKTFEKARKQYSYGIGPSPRTKQYSRRRKPRNFKVATKRKRNISSIVTVYPNPSRRKTKKAFKSYVKKRYAKVFKAVKGKAKRKTLSAMYKGVKKNRGKKIVVINKGAKRMVRKRSYKRRNPHYRGTMKRVGRKYGKATKGVYVYSNPGRRHRSRRNVSHRQRHYRRNPGFLSGGSTFTRVVGVVGGVAVTKLLTGFLPAGISTGVIGYAATAAVAVLQGKLIGKVTKNAGLGTDMMIGGLAYLTARILTDLVPSIGHYTGISGMGLIGPSSFYTPQVNQNGNMGSFVLPAAVAGAIPAPAPVAAPANAGVGRLRRMGRLM